MDPLAEKFPYLTQFQYASNNPILNIDLDGLEGIGYFKPIISMPTPSWVITKPLTQYYTDRGNSPVTAFVKAQLTFGAIGLGAITGGFFAPSFGGALSSFGASAYGTKVLAGMVGDSFSQLKDMTLKKDKKYNFTSTLAQFYQGPSGDFIKPALGTAFEFNTSGFSDESIFGNEFNLNNFNSNVLGGYLGNKISGKIGGNGDFSIQASGEIIGNQVGGFVLSTGMLQILSEVVAPSTKSINDWVSKHPESIETKITDPSDIQKFYLEILTPKK